MVRAPRPDGDSLSATKQDAIFLSVELVSIHHSHSVNKTRQRRRIQKSFLLLLAAAVVVVFESLSNYKRFFDSLITQKGNQSTRENYTGETRRQILDIDARVSFSDSFATLVQRTVFSLIYSKREDTLYLACIKYTQGQQSLVREIQRKRKQSFHALLALIFDKRR